jgi:hypothetical protein
VALLLSSPRTPAAASGAGFGGAQPPSNRFIPLRAYSLGFGSQARCADDAHCIRHASSPEYRALRADCRRIRGLGIHRAAVVKALKLPILPRAPGQNFSYVTSHFGVRPVSQRCCGLIAHRLREPEARSGQSSHDEHLRREHYDCTGSLNFKKGPADSKIFEQSCF